MDVAGRARAGVLVDVPHHQAQRHLERRGEGHAALLALLDVVLRLFQLIAHELQLRPLREVADREDGGEDLLQARVAALRDRDAKLKKLVVARSEESSEGQEWGSTCR